MRIDHVTIATDDLETTVAFYRDVLGLVVGPRPAFPFAGAWLYANGRPIVHLRAPGAEGTPMRHSMLCSTRTISLRVHPGSYCGLTKLSDHQPDGRPT